VLTFLLLRLWPKVSANILREPKILMYPPYRLVYRDIDDARGSLREDFTAWALVQGKVPFSYLKNTRGKKCPDFLVHDQDRQIVLEVGGKGKGTSQFKGLSGDFCKIVLKEGPPYGGNSRPLWLLGLLKAS
jgi:hypothetical protein